MFCGVWSPSQAVVVMVVQRRGSCVARQVIGRRHDVGWAEASQVDPGICTAMAHGRRGSWSAHIDEHVRTGCRRGCDGAAGSGGGSGGGGGCADGMRLVQLLVACAEAVACCDYAQAVALLRELQVGAPVHGTAFQRVVSCFMQGLADRLALAHPPALGSASMVFCIPPSCTGRDSARPAT
ncbi:hypothetical protein C2845_PM16G02480 [Panicum miliaceum]|uniref:Uncharacterized protein n=1 Tax=Panicum miliaceum TaxID=4540 RepID=A0A3L6PYJ3_PANMI|nr:hypothetical protein C2845_PM16G02480 [Panicum miliaceum]